MVQENMKRRRYHLVLLTEGMQDEKIETTMEYFAEGVIAFNTEWSAEAVSKNLVIKKMSGTVVPTRRLPYTIGKKGFIIETATRIT